MQRLIDDFVLWFFATAFDAAVLLLRLARGRKSA